MILDSASLLTELRSSTKGKIRLKVVVDGRGESVFVVVRGYVFIRTVAGEEKNVFEQLGRLPEVREVHIVSGDYDLVCGVESEEEPVFPGEKITQVVTEVIRKIGGITETRTLIPLRSTIKSTTLARPERLHKVFVLVKAATGKEKEVMAAISEIDEVGEIHLVTGEDDLLVALEVEKAVVPPLPEKVANVVTGKIGRTRGVLDTKTIIPDTSIIRR